MSTTFIRTTQDGRHIEVIDGVVCLDGKPEARSLVPLDEHPNQQAIRLRVPKATHMAGRLALTAEEAAQIGEALRSAQGELDVSPQSIHRRVQAATLLRARMEGIE